MYQESSINGITNLDSSEIYFILKWGELFHKVPLNYRTIIPLCSRSILKESIDVLKLADLGILKEYNVTNILESLIESIKSDDILQLHFKRDYEHLMNELTLFYSNLKAQKDEKVSESIVVKERQRKTLVLLCESLLNKMESTDILKLYKEFLRTNVSSAKYGQIDSYVESLAGELIHEGHSKQYLFEWGQEKLVLNSKGFSDRLNDLLKIGKRKIQEYECIFEISLDRVHLTFPSLYQSEGDVVFIESRRDELNRLKLLTKQKDVNGVGDFFSRNCQLVRVTVTAVDIYSAVDEAKRKLMSVTKIFNVHPKFTRFDPSIGEYLIIFTKHDNKITHFHDTAKPDVLTLGEAINLFEIKTTAPTEKSYKGLDQLLQWCRVVQESPKETSIVAMWSMLEFLFASEQKDKFGAVRKYTKAYIAHYYAKSLLIRTNQLLKRDSTNYNNLINAVNAYKPNCITSAGNIKFECLFEYITENVSSVLTIYQNDTLCTRYIKLIEMLTKIKTSRGKEPKRIWLLHFIQQVEKQVISDLQRAYRARNILAHQALSEGDHLDDIYNKLIFYVQIILNNVIYSMKKQPYNTIQQLNELKFITYENYIRGIDRHLTSPFNFDELISNEILYLD